MADAADRYRKLIDATLRAALTARLGRPMPDGLTMELALPAIAHRMGLIGGDDDRLFAAIARSMNAPADAPVLDGAGQTRSTYRPLLMRAVAPFSRAEADDGMADYYRRTRMPLITFGQAREPIRASDGAEIAGRLFDALAYRAIRRSHSPDGGNATMHDLPFDRMVEAQAADGTFLSRTSADQLEPAWYHELAVLHAVRWHADHGDPDNERVARAAARSAQYHAAEVQPDHASSHPFGLAALLEDAEGIFLADMMLHAAGVQQPATMDAVSLVLLYDAIDSVRGMGATDE